MRAAHVAHPEVRGLAVWSAISGAILALVLFALFEAFVSVRPGSTSRWLPLCATLVVLMSPLFWFTALRPLSDMTGLAAAVAAQALIVGVLTGLAGPSALMWGGLLSGVAIGIRSQTALLTLPLLVLAVLLPRSGLRAQNRFAAVGAAALGVLVWAVPLIVASGGLSEYARVLGSQAGEDFSGVVMLWTTRTKAAALDAAMYSFLWPWGHPIAGAVVVTAGPRRGFALPLGDAARSCAAPGRVCALRGVPSAVSGNDHRALRVAAGRTGRVPCDVRARLGPRDGERYLARPRSWHGLTACGSRRRRPTARELARRSVRSSKRHGQAPARRISRGSSACMPSPGARSTGCSSPRRRTE